jgi:hypothetical protein
MSACSVKRLSPTERMKAVKRILQKVIGHGKVRIRTIPQQPGADGLWDFIYDENGKVHKLALKTREERDALIQEFGGLNPDSVAAPPAFIKYAGTWSVQALLAFGHSIKQITLEGLHVIPHPDAAGNSRTEVKVPEGCGHSIIPRKRGKAPERGISISTFTRTKVSKRVRAFDSDEEANKFLSWYRERFPNVIIYICEMITVNNETGQSCKWVTQLAGDGSRRKEMILQAVDGVHYSKMPYYDVLDAAGCMIHSECSAIPSREPRTPPPPRKICTKAAEEGRVDVYE